MPKLTLTVDTETNEISCDVDGNAVSNINEVSLSNYGYGDNDTQFHFYVTSYEKVGEVAKVTRLFAANSPEGKEAINKGTAKASVKHPGFVEVEGLTKAQQEISDMLSRKLKKH